MTVEPLHPLVALNEYSEEVRAGYGSAAVTVRTLDRVSLAIHANELLIVEGGVASGAASLIAAIVGRRDGAAVIRRGVRHIDSAVQIRRARIDRTAMHALLHAWMTHSADPSYRAQRSLHHLDGERRVLYVLRVREPTVASVQTRTRSHASVWGSWVDAVRQRGGSVLVHTTTALDSIVPANIAPHVVREATPEPVAIRLLRCDAGRVQRASVSSSANASPTSSGPNPTAWPEP